MTGRIEAEALHAWTTQALGAVGVPAEDATLIARCLVDVDLRGVRSHGTRQLRRYIPEFRDGQVNRTPNITVLRETDNSLRLDGDGGAGYLVATRATDGACTKAKQVGLALASSRNHGHVGSAGIYGRRVLSHGLIGWCVAGAADWLLTEDPAATVWDGMKAPPMCFVVPADEGGPPLVLRGAHRGGLYRDRCGLWQIGLRQSRYALHLDVARWHPGRQRGSRGTRAGLRRGDTRFLPRRHRSRPDR
ncbi:MAG TPA: hypothetical protein EYQ31_01080 [Candidatus Handelsmanbacteria bacterium]|nr:hypothetical protein [Candidatus Handelsmanbacteria bacterium]